MAAKPIVLANRTFNRKGDAETYYLDQSKQLANSKEVLTEGKLFSELKEIFDRYCEYTEYATPSEAVAFSAKNKKTEVNGRFLTNICYYVHFSDKSFDDFSIKKALTCIANHV
ncbi:hypothetical protein [Citrobacter portucalensis]|uniref:hypothetical protein n=1 Tax=Citrobacter portucalensis TaxID=1639133 RepID=UPI00226BB6EA|nr:hypothetical protein [Citrobacter portucalensis]MCX8984267.1 hypothetical protein [Citrobacter portucalensis]